MTTTYGMNAVEIIRPDGLVVKYLIRAVESRGPQPEIPRTKTQPGSPARPEEWAAWEVVSPEGNTYRVSCSAAGVYWCDCPAHGWNGRGAGRWCKIGERAVCKHVFACWNDLVKPVEEVA